MKLLPIIASSSIAAASAAGLRNSNSRDLGLVFDTEETAAFDTARVTSAIETADGGPAATNSFKEMRIIGGETADKDEFGYTVSLEDDIGHFCGGTLVRRDIVISAAHCAGGPMWARVGAHNIRWNEGEKIKVKKEIKSNQYNPSNTDYDFMILVLEDPAPADVPLAKLHDGSDVLQDNDSLTVIGWGNMATNGWDMPDEKQHVEVKYVPNNDCNSGNSYNGEITNSMLCAGETSGGQDACQGDSGGPLMRLGSGNQQDELVGVVSWGYGCGDRKYPGVYSRITEVLTWIENTIESESRFSDSDSDSDSGSNPTTTTDTGSSYSEPSDYVNPDWREVFSEDFTNDFGKNGMEKGGTHARQYKKAFGKIGIARIQHGKGKKSSITTKKISARRSVAHQEDRGKQRSTDWKITFIFQGKGMEENEDRFCVKFQEDKKDWEDARCYMSGKDFYNGEWVTETLIISVKDTVEDVKFRFECEGDNRTDDVLFDKITIEVEK